jgi:glycosyltransferase involved in cell wall biosynthesis
LGHNICVYTISKNSEEELNALEQITGTNIKVYTLPSIDSHIYKGERLSIPLGLSIKDIRRFKADIIHTHTPFSAGWEAVICAKRLKILLVGTHHTFFNHYLKYVHMDYKWVEKFSWTYTVGYYNRCNIVLSPTQSLADGLRDNKLKKEIDIMPNPVDVEKYCPAIKEGAHEKTLLYMGRVSYEKSIDQVIKAAHIVKNTIPNIKLIIVGDGPEKENLIKLSNDLGLQDNIVFTGFIYGDNLIRTLQSGDIFLSGSKSENMPLAVLESMAIGLPILSVSSLGMVEIVKDNENGFLLSPDNPDEMAEKILYLLNDEQKLKAFSEKSRELSLSYSDTEYAKKLKEIYKKLI